jgi:mono/diheme cytochrome c family protein
MTAIPRILHHTLIFILILFFLNACDTYPYKQGRMYYTQYCANCHLENGEGLHGLIPPLKGADYLTKSRELLPCVIRKGLKDSVLVNGIVYGVQEMAGIPKLTDFEITNILNYINTSWGNNLQIWTIDEVRTHLKKCE